MIDLRRSIPILATLVLLFTACGGGGGGPASGEPADSTAGAGQTHTPTEAPAAAASPAGASAPEVPSGGGAAAGVCALVTEDELGGILGVAVRTTVIAGPPDTCDIQSTDGAPLAAFVLTSMGAVTASAVYDAYASDPAAAAVPGIGEKAAYSPTQATLVILKNGAVLSIAVFDDGTGDEAARLDLMKQIGSLAAGRM